MSRMFKVEIIKNGEVKMTIITNERLTNGQVTNILFSTNLLSALVLRYYAYEMDPERWLIDEE